MILDHLKIIWAISLTRLLIPENILIVTDNQILELELFIFKLAQPSMVWNSHDVPEPDYKMVQSYKVDKETGAAHMLSWTASVANGFDGGLRCLVINSHGKPGKILIGTGISKDEAHFFSQLSGKVNTIFIIACRVAMIGGGGSSGGCEIGNTDGNLFCGEIAKASGANVFCSTAFQDTGAYTLLGLPFATIDEYEGSVFKYYPNGSNKEVSNEYITNYVRRQRLGLKQLA